MDTASPQGEVLRAIDRNGDGRADSITPVLTNLPLGAHGTNGLALGHDGMIYVANGSANYTGFGAEGGPRETPPYSGSILRFRPDASYLKPTPSMVVATGFRNPYDLAFFPTHHPAVKPGQNLAAVSMNGPDGGTYNGHYRPVGEDTLSVFDAANTTVEHFGFPYCLYERARGGLNGFTQAPEEGPCNPLPAKAYAGLVGPTVQAKPSVLFGDHVSSDGIAFNPGTNFPPTFDNDLFVAEWGAAGNAGHKVVRVHFDAAGHVVSVSDFLTGVLPLDLTFAPDGSLYVADMAGPIYRIAAIR
jgi:glucose/arabinose dehydrogenase